MTPIYFHRNNTCRVHSNAVGYSFQIQNTIVPHSHHHWLCIFASDKQEPACCARTNLHQGRRPTFSQLPWQRRCQVNVARVVYFSSARTDRQMVQKPGYTEGVAGQSSQTSPRDPRSSDWHRAWRYRVAGQRLSCSLTSLWKFRSSA
jgi:hypothetical protein